MIYTKNYFGKEKIESVSLKDLMNYFKEEKEENDKIEYKSFVQEKGKSQRDYEKTIIQSICGFLNSEGGLIIWGAPKGTVQENRKEKIFKGELTGVDFLYEKDQFISKVTDSITPIPRGILFHRLENKGKYYYIIEIPQSEYSPHQFDGRFYMRIDGQTKPAPYHYIEALFKKIKFPDIRVYLKIEGWQHLPKNMVNQRELYNLHLSIHFFNFSKLQNDYNLSYRIFCSNGKFQHWNSQFKNNDTSYSLSGHEKNVTNIKDVFHYGEPIREIATIEFEPNELFSASGETTIMVFIGTKYSPMRGSNYKLTLTQEKPSNFNSWFTEIKENIYMHEVSDMSEEEKLKIHLGR